MTQYERLVWVDSDSLVVNSLQPLLAQADRLEDPGSQRPGPRIGASYDGEWWDQVIYKGETPTPGSVRDDINTGVFVIKPGWVYDNILILFTLFLLQILKNICIY